MRFFLFNTIAMCIVALFLIYYYFAYVANLTGNDLSLKVAFFGTNFVAFFLLLNAAIIMIIKKLRHSQKY